MTRDEKVAEAVRLHDQGLNDREIGERLGVTGAAVWKWRHPERVREMHRRDAARPERHQRKLAWTRQARQDPTKMKPCPLCGEATGSFLWSSDAPEACETCRRTAIEERWRQIEAWWADGLTMRQIAEELDWTMNHVRAEFGRMRNAGRDLPNRRTPEQCARIREARWAA